MSLTLKGAYPGGAWESLNSPSRFSLASNMSMAPCLKLAANSTGPPLVIVKVIPLYTFVGEPGTSVSAAVPKGGRQPEIVPSSLAKMNKSLLNPSVPLNTCPVGVPAPGIETSKDFFTTCVMPEESLVTAYNVESPLPLSLTQKGVGAPKDMPHAFTRLVSRSWAIPGWSDTRLICW